tara:strand:- start:30954 stop:31850 length:897 start_codon:yes stop_codon:yes gene_type:complete
VTILERENYPDLFIAADNEARRRQMFYFRLLVAQYLCLSVASAVTLAAVYVEDQKIILLIYLGVLIAGSIAAMLLATMKPNQSWYQMRALAESCKTLAWRYMMAAEPFNDRTETSRAKAVFAERLHDLLMIQNLDASALLNDDLTGEHATEKMEDIRLSTYEDRREFYLKGRIDEQLKWYNEKAIGNKYKSNVFSFLTVLIYVTAIVTTVAQIRYSFFPNSVIWISEPLLVVAASVLGYAQAKRFAELSSSYALTALEIRKLRSGFMAVRDDDEFVDYVREAESAFSREHTQWIARSS